MAVVLVALRLQGKAEAGTGVASITEVLLTLWALGGGIDAGGEQCRGPSSYGVQNTIHPHVGRHTTRLTWETFQEKR